MLSIASDTGPRRLFALSIIARLPLVMFSIGLLVHTEHLTGSFAAAGPVTGVRAVSLGVGGPLLRQLVDRRGQTTVLLATAIAIGAALGAATGGTAVDQAGPAAAFVLAATGEFGEKANAMPKYVVSSTLDEAEWNNSTVLGGDVVEDVTNLKREVDGGDPGRRQRATRADAGRPRPRRRAASDGVPVVLGSGKRLFGNTDDKKPLLLVGSKTVGDGVAILTYEPAREASDAGQRR